MGNENSILIQEEKAVVTITLNRPQTHNAFDDKLISELLSHIKYIAQTSKIRVVILQAHGKSFSAGADLNWMKRMANYTKQENLTDAMQLSELMENLYQLPQPTIALIQGPSYGGGVGLVACCDIAIASKQAMFCFSEVKLGLIPAVISPYVCAAIGERALRRYFLTAESFNAEQAMQLGLISEVISENKLYERGQALAQTIIANGPQAVSAAKQLIHKNSFTKITQEYKQELAQMIAQMRVSKEGQEGINAFLSKRKPGWMID